MISPQIFTMFWPQTKLYKGSIVFLDDFVRGQVKMDTKNTPLPLNTTRLILMYKVGQGVRGQTVLSQNDDVKW